jgi:hypothetical protein
MRIYRDLLVSALHLGHGGADLAPKTGGKRQESAGIS